MHRTTTALHGGNQSFVDEPVAVPSLLTIVWLRQVRGLLDKCCQHTRLRHRLSRELSYPLSGTVGRDGYERLVLVHGFRHRRREVEQCRAAGNAYGDGLVRCLADTEGVEPCAALVGNGMTGNGLAVVEVVNDGRIA